MKIVHLTTTDPAGAAMNMVNAINLHTPHRARLIATNYHNIYQFPQDIHWVFDGGDEILQLLEDADVVHLHKINLDFDVELKLPKAGMERKINMRKLIETFPNKKVLYHIHGHPYERGNVAENAEIYKKTGGLVLASTPDLEEMYRPHYERVQYFPNCVPVNNVLYLPRGTQRPVVGSDGTERFIVGQTPTHAILKNVNVIEEAVSEIAKESKIQVVYHKIWNQAQENALRFKRQFHVVFDHLEGYYGLSSLEGLSMGKPVIAGLSEYTQAAIRKFFHLDTTVEGQPIRPLPWLICQNKESVKARLNTLLQDTEYRLKVGEESRKFMEEVWSDRAIGQRLAEIYSSL